MAEAQVAREVIIRQAGQKGYERRVEADSPRGERELSMKSSFPVVSPRPGGEAGAVMLGAAGGGSPEPSVGAKSVLVGLTRGREVRPVDRRLTAKATAVRKEPHRASVSKIGGSRIAKKQALRRSPEGPAKRREVNVAGRSVAKAGLKTSAARAERDVDIITAIVK